MMEKERRKNRKIEGPMKRINVFVPQETRAKLDEMAGRHSAAATVEFLIERAYLKRAKAKTAQQLQDSSC